MSKKLNLFKRNIFKGIFEYKKGLALISLSFLASMGDSFTLFTLAILSSAFSKGKLPEPLQNFDYLH